MNQFAQLKRVEAELRKEADAKLKILDKMDVELEIQRKSLSNAQKQLVESTNANTRRAFEQYIDFAIRSLPFWKRFSISAVANKALAYQNMVDAYVAKNDALRRLEAMEADLERAEKEHDPANHPDHHEPIV